MKKDVKPWLHVDDQLQQWMQRGMAVTDRARAPDCIEHLGYSMRSGYRWDRVRQAIPPMKERGAYGCVGRTDLAIEHGPPSLQKTASPALGVGLKC